MVGVAQLVERRIVVPVDDVPDEYLRKDQE